MQRLRILNPKMIYSRCCDPDMTVGKSDKKAKIKGHSIIGLWTIDLLM